MTTRIKPATNEDVSDIVHLLNEMDTFYGDETTETFEERANTVSSVLFGSRPSAYVILAITERGQAVGLASYSFLWPAIGSSRSLYLKELYVANEQRKSGVGRQLMQELFDIAKRAACSRVEWTTDLTNTDAQEFYGKLGDPTFSGKVFYRHEIVS